MTRGILFCLIVHKLQEVSYYVAKTKSDFLVISATNSDFKPFLSNTPLVNEFILLIPHSYNGKETDSVSTKIKSLVRRVFLE